MPPSLHPARTPRPVPAGRGGFHRRLLGSLGLALALTGGLTVSARADSPPAASPVPAAATSTLTSTSATTVPAGRSFTISGRLVQTAPLSTTTSAGTSAAAPAKTTGVAGAAVVLQWRTVGSAHWSNRTVLTSSKGAWSTTLSVARNSQLRARYAGAAASTNAAGAAVPAVSASRTATSTITALQSVSIATLSPARPAIGQLLSIGGTASKALRGTTVDLQRFSDNRWTTVTTATVSSTGSYAAKFRITSAAALSLRARSTSSATVTRAYSARRTVSVAVSATLYPGQTLGARRVLTAPNGLYTATVQTDGNLVVRDSSGARLWASGTAGASPTLSLSSTGAVVLAGKAGPIWSTGTTSTPVAAPRLVLQNDGNLVLWSKAHSVWSWKTGPSTTVRPAACWSTSFDCISYTGYTPSTSYWRMYAGHNCTNYVAYRMISRGVATPPWGLPGGSAWQWRAGATKAGIAVDQTPTVGAVMQWNRNTYGGGSSGHVVYVERVTSTGVVISEDSWSGHASVRTILKTSPAYASARFLHIADTV